MTCDGSACVTISPGGAALPSLPPPV